MALLVKINILLTILNIIPYGLFAGLTFFLASIYAPFVAECFFFVFVMKNVTPLSLSLSLSEENGIDVIWALIEGVDTLKFSLFALNISGKTANSYDTEIGLFYSNFSISNGIVILNIYVIWITM